MALETEYGVPAVAVHADAFARLVDSVLRANGMPAARRAYVPTPVMARTPAELRAYIEGDDPVRGRPFMAEVLDALSDGVPEPAPRTTCSGASATTAGRTSCPSCCPPRSASRRCSRAVCRGRLPLSAARAVREDGPPAAGDNRPA
jgi:hypothetical protein